MADYSASVEIEAPPDIVFAHLVTPQGMVSWMGQHARLEPTAGGEFAVDVNGTPIRGSFLEVDPPRLVVVSWGMAGNDELPPGSSQVRFTLTPTQTGTRVDLLHTGLPESHAPMHAHGWSRYLPGLQAAVVRAAAR